MKRPDISQSHPKLSSTPTKLSIKSSWAPPSCKSGGINTSGSASQLCRGRGRRSWPQGLKNLRVELEGEAAGATVTVGRLASETIGGGGCWGSTRDNRQFVRSRRTAAEAATSDDRREETSETFETPQRQLRSAAKGNFDPIQPREVAVKERRGYYYGLALSSAPHTILRATVVKGHYSSNGARSYSSKRALQ
eukprot:GHVT01018665.1.p1 GENE.GHVT01018665.1~~GHVT01018665.1.p1  ORF type:complete len:193 (+),score=28.04 GHVT01018665.1:760-1338(+)